MRTRRETENTRGSGGRCCQAFFICQVSSFVAGFHAPSGGNCTKAKLVMKLFICFQRHSTIILWINTNICVKQWNYRSWPSCHISLGGFGVQQCCQFKCSSPNTIFPSTSPLSGKKGMEDLAGMDAELKKMAAQLHGNSQWANEPGRAAFQWTISESYSEMCYRLIHISNISLAKKIQSACPSLYSYIYSIFWCNTYLFSMGMTSLSM